MSKSISLDFLKKKSKRTQKGNNNLIIRLNKTQFEPNLSL